MNPKRLVVTVAVLVLVASGTLRPSPVRADTAENFLIAGCALAVYVGAIVIGTHYAYRSAPPPSLVAAPARILWRYAHI